MRFRGATVLFYLFLLGIMMPSEAIVVPLYFDLRTLGLTDTLLGGGAAAGRPVGGLRHVLDAGLLPHQQPRRWSRRPGSTAPSNRRILWSVLLPLARPAVVTLIVLVFMWTWNEFLIPLVMVTTESLRTAPLGLAFFQGQYTQGFTLLAAGAVIVAMPVVVVYLFLQRHFIRGMLEGAVRE